MLAVEDIKRSSLRDGCRLGWARFTGPISVNRLFTGWTPKGGSTRKWPMPELAGAVVLWRRGGVMVGLETGLYAFDVDAAALEPICLFEDAHPDDRTNDSRCDHQGRLWFSRMRDFGRTATGAVYRMDATLRPMRVISEVRVPNAICFSPEGDRIYLADTSTGVIEVLDLEAANGELSNRSGRRGARKARRDDRRR
jgi:sugar lactone lactonase YvrE